MICKRQGGPGGRKGRYIDDGGWRKLMIDSDRMGGEEKKEKGRRDIPSLELEDDQPERITPPLCHFFQ